MRRFQRNLGIHGSSCSSDNSSEQPLQNVDVLNTSKVNYHPIPGQSLKKILECHICYGQMSEKNNLMCYHCSKTWCSRCFRLAIRQDKR